MLPRKQKNIEITIISEEEIESLKKLFRKAVLAAYQLFYNEGLTNVNGGLVKIKPVIYLDQFFRGFELECKTHPELNTTGRTPEELMENFLLLEKGLDSGKKKISAKACCILAEHNPCVCIESFKCPIHGTTCHGSHD